MDSVALAHLLYNEQKKINKNDAFTAKDKVESLYNWLLRLLDLLTQKEQIQFTTLFAKIAYVGHRYNLNSKLQYYIHLLRKEYAWIREGKKCTSSQLDLANKVLADLIEAVLMEKPPSKSKDFLPESFPFEYKKIEVQTFRPKVRVLIIEDNYEEQFLIAKEEGLPGKTIRIKYGMSDRNESFNPTIQNIRKWLSYPLTMNLLSVEVDAQGNYHPQAFVLEPDYLVDISAIAACFTGKTTEISSFLLKKFRSYSSSVPLVLGNISNFFLDELVNNPKADFKQLFTETFRIYPLVLSLFNDRQISELYKNAINHFAQLQKVVNHDLPKENFDLKDGCIEPSFYSEKYGLQGRLDLFLQGKRTGIVELKSGKIYNPNVYGLGQSHFVQTLLYDLLISSVYNGKIDPVNYILYSGVIEKPLRFAPRIRAQQWEAIEFRNQIIILEKRLLQVTPDEKGLQLGQKVFKYLTVQGAGWLSGFEKEHIQSFERHFSLLSKQEQNYILAFVGFIAREHHLAKTGIQGAESINGQAALWLESFTDKRDNFRVFNHLKFLESKIENQRDHFLTFSKSHLTAPLANFRKGDIAVLYPFRKDRIAPLYHQIYKCTIIENSSKTLTVRLRARQTNVQPFLAAPYWNLEHDTLDSGFNSMYAQLRDWMLAQPRQRSLLLGLEAPKSAIQGTIPKYSGLTQQQNEILQKALFAQDYFLLWGPPGTGKTSIMIKHLAQFLWQETDQHILLMAYTNRAVDELCAAIERVNNDILRDYIRVGSRYSTSPEFHDQLLSNKIQHINNRSDLKKLIQSQRIVVGTVASIINKPELFQLKSFDITIIDEASQILEPNLVGLLTKFKKFILVGDHKQLPAVVVQEKRIAEVKAQSLLDLGLTNLSNSLFDRLYKHCKNMNWHWAYDQLSFQGRMHQIIMDYPNRFFYNKTLNILPETIPHHEAQKAQLMLPDYGGNHPFTEALRQKRMLFINTPPDHKNSNNKVNQHEARTVAEVVKQLINLYPNQPQTSKHFGIITPYRAQIATIKKTLQENTIDPNFFTIDTVERYQGGARNIIILSLCTNTINRLKTMTSITEDGVDRKLNVAITRAKEQLIIIGNRDILEELPLYKALIKCCYCL